MKEQILPILPICWTCKNLHYSHINTLSRWGSPRPIDLLNSDNLLPKDVGTAIG